MLNEIQKKLVEDNIGLVYHFIRRYNLCESEYYDVAAIALCKAALTYTNGIGKFSSYALLVIRNEVYTALKKDAVRSKHCMYIYDVIDSLLPAKQNIESSFIDKESVDRLLKAIDNLPSQEKQIVKLRLRGFTQCAIGKELGISQPTVTKRLKDIKELLYGC